jgi:hypothetical protein
MPAILLKNVPPAIHRRLKKNAAAQRRSLQQETLFTLERGLIDASVSLPPPIPIKTRIPLTDEWLRAAKNEGRP